MNILLDTCTFIWIITDNEKLSSKVKDIYLNGNNFVALSVISFWEMVVKYHIKKLPLPEPPENFVIQECQKNKIEIIPLQKNDILQLSSLPAHHRDPFDRMIVCQALARQFSIVTPDKFISKYPVETIW